MNIIMLCILIGIVLCGFFFERSKGLSYAIMAVFFVLTCFSYDNYDYNVYSTIYDTIGSGGAGHYEPLFSLFMRIGNMVGLSYIQYRMVVVAVSLLLINSTIQRFTNHPALVWALFMIFPGWVLTTLLRHMMAFAVMIYGVRYVFDEKKGSTWKLIISVVIAALFHNSFWMFGLLVLAKLVKGKKILYIGIFVVVLIYSGILNQVLYQVIEFFLTEEFYLDKYMSGQVANWNGTIYNIVKQCMIITFGYGAVHLYQRRKNAKQSLSAEQIAFMDKIIPINNASVLILGVLRYTTVAGRMDHVIILINIMAWGICLGLYRKNTVNRMTVKFTVGAVCGLLAVLACTLESSVLFDNVLRMHFETNDFINLFA